MKQIKLLVTDLDGTLLKQDEDYIANWASLGISKNNQLAVNKLIENKIELAIATGRMKDQCKGALQTIDHIDKYFLSQNGVYIENKNNKIIKKNIFTKEHAQNLMRWFNDHGFIPFFSNYDTIFVDKTKMDSKSMEFIIEHLKHDINKTKFEFINFEDIDYNTMEFANFGLDVTRITIEQMEDLEQYLNQVIDYAQIFITSDNSMDIIPIGVDKAVAIKDLANFLNLDLEEIAFVGDSGNDRPALQLLHHSFVIDHARDNVKVHANHVVKSVAQAIDMIIKYNNDIK